MEEADEEYLDAKRDILQLDHMPALSEYIQDQKQ